MAALLLGICTVGANHAAEAECKIEKYGELPVVLQDGRAILKAGINGQDATFIVDSGAFYSSLTQESAARLGLPIGQVRTQIEVVGVGGRVDAHQTSVKLLVIPGRLASLQDVEFMVFGNAIAAEADGLLGENILGAADTEYDLDNGVIRLMRSRGCDNTKMAYWTTSPDFGMITLAGRTAMKSLVIGHATLNGADIEVVFDTGAPQSSLTLKAAARAGVTPDSPGIISGGVGRGLGPEVSETWIGRFLSLNLGGEEIRNIPLRFGRNSYGGNGDLLLGLDFFRSHHIYVAKNQNRMFFTYNGGKVFDLSVLPGANSAKKRDSEPAVQSVSPDATPLDLDGYRKRAAAYAEHKQFDLAIADLSHALALQPNDIDLLLTRGRLRLASHDPQAATKDFSDATDLAPKNPNVGLRIAYAYESNHDFVQAINEFNKWVNEYSTDERVPRALHERCWCRAASGVELQSALEDCDAAIKRHNDDSQARVNRGLVWLRLGLPDKAIADFKAAIDKQPKSAWAFFGRAIAESRAGDVAHANEDIKAATGLDSTVPAQFRAIGLEPSS